MRPSDYDAVPSTCACATCGADMTGKHPMFAGAPTEDGGCEADYCVKAEDATAPIYCGEDCKPDGLTQMSLRGDVLESGSPEESDFLDEGLARPVVRRTKP